MIMQDLKGKTAIITGGAMGLGKATALRLAADGSDIVIADMEEDAARDVLQEIETLGRKALFCKVDVSQWDQVTQMVDKTLETFGRVDVLFCSAGISGPLKSRVDQYERAAWDQVMAVNITGTFLCCRAVLPSMLQQQSGRIVTVSSMAAKDGNANMCGYVAAKGAVLAFTKGLAKEVAQDGILVHCIAPTVIEGRFLEFMGESVKKALKSKIPMGRFGQASEVAALVKFLVSEECSFSTGFCHDLSGGRAVY